MRAYILPLLLVLTLVCHVSLAPKPQPVTLPPPQTSIGKPLMQTLAQRHSTRAFAPKALPAQELSNLLWAAFGINREDAGKRTAPSAMNAQEIDLYVTLPEGTYRYVAKGHVLEPVNAKDLRAATGRQPFAKDAAVNIVYVADFAKLSRASGEDKLLYSGADAGFIAENAYLYCASQGLAVVVRASVDRDALAKELGLRTDQKIIFAQSVGFPAE